jgi:hypothetical protein
MEAWQPWAELDRRTYIDLVKRPMPDYFGTIEELSNGRRRITLDCGLDERQQRATLTHELVHDDLDLLYDDDTPVPLVAKMEALVEDETARRLVPPTELDRYVRERIRNGGAVTWRDVAEWFDVPRDVCEAAFKQLLARTNRYGPTARPEEGRSKDP